MSQLGERMMDSPAREVTQMPKYQLRFFVETPLRADQDMRFRSGEHDVTILFGSGNNNDHGIEAEVVCEGKSWQDAVALGSNDLVVPVLDAISFHRKCTVLLGQFTRILKDEGGQRRRKTILKRSHRWGATTHLHPAWLEEIQRVIGADPELRKLALRWLRNAYRPIDVLEEFIYTWIALENLAGETMVETACPSCGEKLPRRRAGDRTAAYEIVKAHKPEIDERTFKDWWWRLRNSLFHGGKEPDAGFRAELQRTAEVVMSAAEAHLERTLGITNRAPQARPITPQTGYDLWYFLEFDVPNPEDEFSQQVPRISRLEELSKAGRPYREEMSAETLDQKSFEGW